MAAYWLIIGPLVVLALGMMGRLWYVAGGAHGVGSHRRGVAGYRRSVDSGE